jgi:hypothetical protein
LPLVDRSGLVYVLDGVNDGDSRWSPGILRPALIPSAGFNQCRNCIVESEMKSSEMKLDRGEYPEARPLGGESGRGSPHHMAASDRFTLGVLSFLSLGTFAAIFGATQERKVERYRRQGRKLPPGFD